MTNYKGFEIEEQEDEWAAANDNIRYSAYNSNGARVVSLVKSEEYVKKAIDEILEKEAKKTQKPASIEEIKCSCGHMENKAQVMSSSRGSCCVNCYERMSD